MNNNTFTKAGIKFNLEKVKTVKDFELTLKKAKEVIRKHISTNYSKYVKEEDIEVSFDLDFNIIFTVTKGRMFCYENQLEDYLVSVEEEEFWYNSVDM